jgi:deoxyadenosine/deoxycytidine kinase
MDLRLDLIVYLRTTPEVAYSRMRTRGREAEKAAQLSYLSALHEAYEDWLVHEKMGSPPAPVLIIDADQDLDTLRKTYTQHINRIRNIPPEVRQPLGDITEGGNEQSGRSNL